MDFSHNAARPTVLENAIRERVMQAKKPVDCGVAKICCDSSSTRSSSRLLGFWFLAGGRTANRQGPCGLPAQREHRARLQQVRGEQQRQRPNEQSLQIPAVYFRRAPHTHWLGLPLHVAAPEPPPGAAVEGILPLSTLQRLQSNGIKRFPNQPHPLPVASSSVCSPSLPNPTEDVHRPQLRGSSSTPW
ncbi:hypothetical protein cyc_02988 [Cyclospora cayetanensis]|uniref:Uncharacterized protein n=1 Tax=Cyclospora cayetanensis TaxID=88456 RepID=A0A1D3CXF6_9EIME|nr:hypothetical protein cyc_02988 [Cyclospora cayetanensis]